MPKRRNATPQDITTLLYGVGVVLLLTALGVIVWLFVSRNHSAKIASVHDRPPGDTHVALDCPFHRYVDGVCVDTEEQVNEPFLGVMIENHVDARPQAGLAEASIVYEAPVEANITRFLALFPVSKDVKKAGPVRSARPYYLDWLEEYPGVMYMHVGGSPDALARIEKDGLFDLNEFYHGWYYWRSEDRSAPHNVYTSSKLWQKAWDDEKDSTMGVVSTWQFSNEPSNHDTAASTVTASFAPPAYQAVWTYDETSKVYHRLQKGLPHRDDDGTEITADTVIIQRVKTRILDSYGRLSLGSVGTGDAIVFRDGVMITGTWRKNSPSDRTQFIGVSGNNIPLKPGHVWIEVVPQDGGVTYE